MWAALIGLLAFALASFAQPPSRELRAKIEAKIKEISSWSTNPEVVAAVKAHNADLPADAKGMTNEKWKQLTLLDPFVRSFSKNSAAMTLKAFEKLNPLSVSITVPVVS